VYPLELFIAQKLTLAIFYLVNCKAGTSFAIYPQKP